MSFKLSDANLTQNIVAEFVFRDLKAFLDGAPIDRRSEKFGPGWMPEIGFSQSKVSEQDYTPALSLFLITGCHQHCYKLNAEFSMATVNPQSKHPFKKRRFSALKAHGCKQHFSGRGINRFISVQELRAIDGVMEDDAFVISVNISCDTAINLTEGSEGELRSCGHTLLLKVMTARNELDVQFGLFKRTPHGPVTSKHVGAVYFNSDALRCATDYFSTGQSKVDVLYLGYSLFTTTAAL